MRRACVSMANNNNNNNPYVGTHHCSLCFSGGKAPKASAVEEELQKIHHRYSVIEPSKFDTFHLVYGMVVDMLSLSF